MSRYIDADKLKTRIAPESDFRHTLVEWIDLQETEDVAPVIHAHWTRKRTLSHDGELYCSNCEWTPEVLGGTTLGDLQLADVYYCPHCGAKMDEEVKQ